MTQVDQKPRLRPTASDVATFDSFQNFLTRTGIGAGSVNDGARYGFNPVTRNRVQLEQCYRGSWICGRVVDSIAEDMTREGVEITSDDKPDALAELDREAKRLQLWPQLCEGLKWSRLYGGSIAYMMIDGQDPSTPLRLDTIRKGQFKGLSVLDRWMLQPTMEDLIQELGPDLGKPKYYDVLPDAGGIKRQKIHHSRAIRLEGISLPYWQRIGENGWGMSVLERMWDRLIPFDSMTTGVAQLVYKAHLRTYKVKGLREIIAAGGKALEGLLAQINMIRQFQSNEGLTLMDAEDEFEAHQYTFSGLDAVLLQMGQQLSGATGIPLVRLFGQSPAGLNSTGESDLRNYYDGIKNDQETDLRTGIERIYQVHYRSTFGKDPSKGFAVKFRPLWQMSDEQKADVTEKRTAAVAVAYESQLIGRKTALQELKQVADITGAWSNITDEDINAAEDEPAPNPDELVGGVPAKNLGSETPPNRQAPDQGDASGGGIREAA